VFVELSLFKNLIVFRIGEAWQPDAQQLEDALANDLFAPCSPTQALAFGWAPPRGDEHGALIEIVGGQWLLKLAREQRLLPSSVVNDHVDTLAQRVEAETGRKPGKKLRRDLKDQALLDLLPQAFTKRSATRVWIDPTQRLLMVDAGSAGRADEVTTMLVRASSDLPLSLINTAESPAACMAAWLADGTAPEGFQIERECELKGHDDEKPVVRYARHPLDTDEVRQHLTAGKLPTRLALSWRERVSFTLTDTMAIKKINFLDLALEGQTAGEGDDAFDADAALATGLLSKMIPALIDGLGGEQAFGEATAAAPAPALAPTSEAVEGEAPW
jgi:recombination associated protein RdgC